MTKTSELIEQWKAVNEPHDVDPIMITDTIQTLREQQERIALLEQLIRDALEDETEFDTDWDKAAREALAAAEEG